MAFPCVLWHFDHSLSASETNISFFPLVTVKSLLVGFVYSIAKASVPGALSKLNE